ncbi:MAG: NTP transferase domain-containing protein [Candidatus Micrarchaeota archaeon]|nr:NTP transferase domain-containing protein [Candidatus Micrarchaeota archaeon]
MGSEAEKTQVVIAVGGEAKRMGLSIPKALVKVGGSTLLDRCIGMFMGCGFKEFVVLLGYKDTQITEHMDHSDLKGARITKAYDYAQGIAKGKAVKHALLEGKIDKNMRSIMAWPDDLFFDSRLPSAVVEKHVAASKKLGTLSSIVVTEAYRSPFGIVHIDSNGIVTRFEEKPLVPMRTSTGMQVFDPGSYDYFDRLIDMDKPGPVEFENVVLPEMAAQHKIYSISIPPDSWLAVNTQKELEQAQKLVAEGKLPAS